MNLVIKEFSVSFDKADAIIEQNFFFIIGLDFPNSYVLILEKVLKS
jgi:hypothetical protein